MDLCCILPDVQANEPSIHVYLSRVGVSNVQKFIKIYNKKKLISLQPTFDLYIDLPKNRKGANLSRNFEALDSILIKYSVDSESRLENLCNDIALELLKKHEYANTSEVSMKCKYAIDQQSPISNIKNQKIIDINITSIAKKIDNNSNYNIKNIIGVEVIGITACPCAQSMMYEEAAVKLLDIGLEKDTIKKFLSDVPMATHNQRGRAYLSIETFNECPVVDIDIVAKILQNSMSFYTYEVLKRVDEKHVVLNSHKNPKFVEDCVRFIAKELISIFPNMKNDSIITIKQINEESIHQHNAYAEINSTFETLKKEFL